MEGIDKSRVYSGNFNYGFDSAPEIAISSQSQYPLQTNPVNSESYGSSISNFNATQLATGTHPNIPAGIAFSNLSGTPNGQMNNYNYNPSQFAPETHQNIPGMAYSNLAVTPNGQMANYPPSLAPTPNGFQVIAASVMSMDIDENLLKMQHLVNIVTYVVLLISALIVLIGYSIFLAKIGSILDLFGIGNWWMFLNIFLSCTITILVCGFAVGLTFCSKGHLGPKQVAWINVVLALFVMVPVFLGPIGIAESTSSKKNGITVSRHEATNFGRYVQAICGNSTAVLKPDPATAPSDAIFSYWDIKPDPVKCKAIGTLKIGIFCSYAWAIELLIATVISAKFGMRYYNHNSRFF